MVVEDLNDVVLIVLGYGYVLASIILSREASKRFGCSAETARKLLHILVGNLVLLVPLFKNWFSPILIASPFILITLLASPYAPLRLRLLDRIGLGEVSAKGHGLGLVYYSLAYTILAGLFFERPQVIASGIIAMTYGDGFAALVGSQPRFRVRRLPSGRSLGGSLAFFTSSFLGLALYLSYLSVLGNHPVQRLLALSLLVAITGTVTEAATPKGYDNLTVPLLCVAAARVLGEW